MISPQELSRDELVSVLEIIEGAGSCSSRDGLKKLLLSARDLIEADFSICGLVRERAMEPVDTAEIINGSYPEAWLERYTAEKMFLTDPVVRHHIRFSDTHLWKNMPESDRSAERNVIMAMDHGIRYGISGSIYIPERGDVALFAFSGPSDTFGDRHIAILDTLALHLGKTLSGLSYGMSDDNEPPSGHFIY